MAVTTGTVVTGSATTAGPHTVASVAVASGEGLFVAWGSRGTSTVTSVVWDAAGANESLTQIGSELDVDGTITGSIWYIASPTAGTKTVTITFTGGSKNVIAHCVPFAGHDTSTTVGTSVTDSGAGRTAGSTTLTDGTTGDLAIAAVATNRTAGITWTDGSETEIADTSNLDFELAMSTADSDGNVTLASDFAASSVLSQHAVTIFAAAAAAGGMQLVGGAGLVG